MSSFTRIGGNWVELRIFKPREFDLHFGRRDPYTEYRDVMADVEKLVRAHIEQAHREGVRYMMIIHGCSTSRNGATAARSVVRGLMRSTWATSFILRPHCLQHDTVFLACIRPAAGQESKEERLKQPPSSVAVGTVGAAS